MDRNRLLLLAHLVVALGLAAIGALQIYGGATAAGLMRLGLAAVVVGVGYYVTSNAE